MPIHSADANKTRRLAWVVKHQLHTYAHSLRGLANDLQAPEPLADTVPVTSTKSGPANIAPRVTSHFVRSISEVQRKGLVRKTGFPSLGLERFDLLDSQACKRETATSHQQ